MKAQSHRILGRYLVEQYMSDLPRRYIRAFLIGCVEPDRNPATYFKGSIRCQWMRGHNWGNAQRYMNRVSTRLEHKDQLRLLDYYRLGKLIHYATDAFTYAHNEAFHKNLRQHCSYENHLQDFFCRYLAEPHGMKLVQYDSVMDAIQAYHYDYVRHPNGVYTDSRYTVAVCCAVLALLFQNRLKTV